MTKPLTLKQERFVEEYLIDGNATRSAIAAGYAKKSAHVTSHDLLKNPKIREAIAQAKEERSERTKTDADYVLTNLREMYELDLIDILDDEGHPLPLRSWPKAWRIAVTGLDIATVTRLVPGKDDEALKTVVNKLKLPDKLRTLELIGKHVDVQAWRESVSHEAGKSLTELLAQIRESE